MKDNGSSNKNPSIEEWDICSEAIGSLPTAIGCSGSDTDESEPALAVEGDYGPVVRVARPDGGPTCFQDELIHVRSGLPADNPPFASTALYPDSEGELPEVWHTRKFQSVAEENGNVLHNVVAESDALEDVSTEREFWRVVMWLVRFAEERLGLNRDEYIILYSGNRSIHIHTNRFVREENLNMLKKEAEKFNDETGAELDTCIYQSKPQWRLQYATHDETGMKKVEISLDDEYSDIITRANNCEKSPKLPDAIGGDHPVIDNFSAVLNGDAEDLVDEYLLYEGEVDECLSDAEDEPSSDGSSGKSLQDTAEGVIYDYCPHLGARGGDQTDGVARSFAIVELLDGEIIEQDGAYLQRVEIHSAIGANGEFKKKAVEGQMRLSENDVQKWQYDQGDQLVVIGGRSWQARVIDISGEHDLRCELVKSLSIGGRRSALATLEDWDRDIGDSGYHGNRDEDASDMDAPTNVGDRQDDETEAAEIKRKVETGEMDAEYKPVLRVCCRLLKIRGWDSTLEWLKDMYGKDFDSEEAYEKLKDIVDFYDDFGVTVPDREDVIEDCHEETQLSFGSSLHASRENTQASAD